MVVSAANGDLWAWGSPVERERRRRIRLAVAAYAYEIANAPLIDDATFDRVARASDPTITTGRLDEWWRSNFTPHTGQWIHDHPELEGIRNVYERLGRRTAQTS